MYLDCRSYDLMGKVTVSSLCDLRGLCASVRNHDRSFPRKTDQRNARDHEPVLGYAGR